MDEHHKNWFMVGWPVLCVLLSTIYQAGSQHQELQNIQKAVDGVQPLVPRVAVLEAGASQMKEDLQEIKADVKIIREYILNNTGNNP